MKKITTILFLFVFTTLGSINAQVAINTDGSAPDPNAMLDIKSSTKGLLLPRSSSGSISGIAAKNGMMMYDTTYDRFRLRLQNVWRDVVDSRSWTRNLNATDQVVYTFDSVGIGTAAPATKLHIQGVNELLRLGNSNPQITFYQGGTETGTIYLDANDLKLATYASNNTGKVITRVNGGDRFTVAPDGNVGIVTTDPQSRLHISSGQDVGLPNTSNGFVMLGNNTASNLVIDNNEIMARNNGAASDLFIQNDAGNVIMCAGELGGVGIGVNAGTSIPVGYLFAVDGKMIAEELKVQLSGAWPDYVFKHDYKLKNYDALRSFIKTNNHLPNIPAASEVEKNGFEVGDMQKRMMEKIEELTLYILDLEKRIKTMEEKK
jgi:hypothetical protein